MIYRIKFISDETDGFVREIEIDSEATFLDLNKAILDSCNYPDDQMTSFYICDEEWERKQQITREDMGSEASDVDIYTMDKVKLSEFIEDEEQKLEFVFDPFNERVFYLDVKEFTPGKNLDNAVVVRSAGQAPVQIASIEDTDMPANTKKGNIDDFENEDFYGSDDFENDEFDPEGYEISEGNPYQ